MCSISLEKYYLLKNNYYEMLYRRGYYVEKKVLNLNYSQFKKKCIEKKRYFKSFKIINHLNDTNNKIIGFYNNKGLIDVNYLGLKIEKAKTNNSNSIIFITKRYLSKQTNIALSHFRRNFNIEIFFEYEILINPIKHFLVPKHVLLAPDIKRKILKSYNVKDSQLPKIKLSDPISKYYGAKKGNMFKIIRFSENIGVYLSYRIIN
ncbi:RNA polymerase I, II and III (nucleomorph) [Bigelowiella natans]|uniref:RNA polymerase I, II and III n=1 Tax=Bigelowiella natans TaxID=227086 RepID=Q3LW39_BIGNA|nr:RNA polymerase I, II and III [Bigelowiella natans]ABA27326.1 RNA polymerase I, II and III [Bigelowiella natans]